MTDINIVVPCAIPLIACGCSPQLSNQSQPAGEDISTAKKVDEKRGLVNLQVGFSKRQVPVDL
jgi:hypothetical protein